MRNIKIKIALVLLSITSVANAKISNQWSIEGLLGTNIFLNKHRVQNLKNPNN